MPKLIVDSGLKGNFFILNCEYGGQIRESINKTRVKPSKKTGIFF